MCTKIISKNPSSKLWNCEIVPYIVSKYDRPRLLRDFVWLQGMKQI